MIEEQRQELKFKFNPLNGRTFEQDFQISPAYWFNTYKNERMIFNPYTGKLRLQEDFDCDPLGANVVIEYVLNRMGLCKDEGFPQHGTDHVCVNLQKPATIVPGSLDFQLQTAFCNALENLQPPPPPVRYEKIKYSPVDGRALPSAEQRPFEKWRKLNPSMEVRYDPFTGMPYGGKIADSIFLNRYEKQEFPDITLAYLARTTPSAKELRDKVMTVVEALMDVDGHNTALNLLATFLSGK